MALSAITALVILGSGCKKSSFWRIRPGEQIHFVAKSQPTGGNAGTRTVYSGQDFVVDGDTYERIDWVDGDMITVGYVSYGGKDGLCAEYDHYRLSDVYSDGKSSYAGTIQPAGGGTGANGLNWKDNTHHRFFASYPNVDSTDEDFIFGLVSNELTIKVPYKYPEIQVPVGTEEKTIVFCGEEVTATVYKPDMSYAYMFCNPFDYYSREGVLDEKYTPADGAFLEKEATINLPFEPHFTAFEFSAAAKTGESFQLNSVTLSSADEDRPLTGTYIFQRVEYEEDGVTRERWTDVPKEGEISYQARINFTNLTLDDANPIVFTYFLNSWYSFTMLTITFNITKDGTTVNRSLKLKYANDNWVWFSYSMKHRIKNLQVPFRIELGSLWFDSDEAGNYLPGGDPFEGEI